MATFNKVDKFVLNLASTGTINLNSDTLKVALTATAPVQSTADGWSIGAYPAPTSANGYSVQTAAFVSGTQTAGTYKLVLSNVVFTASGGQIGPFEYAILYDDTSSGKKIIGWWDYGGSVTLNDTETFTVVFDAGTGVLTLA